MATEPPPPSERGNAILSGPGQTEEELWRYVRRQLGGGITDVELTARGDKDPVTGQPLIEGETHQDDITADAKRWFMYRVGFKQIVQLMIMNNQSAYIMPSECIEVLEVWLPSFQLPTLDADSFSHSYYTLLFGQWAEPNAAPMPFSDLVMRLQYLQTIGRIFSTDREWMYHNNTRILEILPAPSSVGSFAQANSGSVALVTIWTSDVNTLQLDPMDLDFFRRKMLVLAMKTLANIRTKWDGVSVVGSDRSMNGNELQANAEAIEDKLEEDIKNWKRSVAIIQG